MNSVLDNFIEELKNNQKLQCEFTKCKSLKESFNRFMKGKCSYEEYESFFEDLIQKQTHLSDQDLEQVAGGKALGKILLPVTLVAMLAGASAMSASAAPPKGSSTINTRSTQNKSDQAFVSKLAELGYTCTVNEDDQSVTISSENRPTLDQKIFDDIIKQYPGATIKIGPGIEYFEIGQNQTMDLNFDNAKDLESITVDPKNQRYSTNGIALYSMEKESKQIKYLLPLGTICDETIGWCRKNNLILVLGISDEKLAALDLSIFDDIIKQYPNTTIRIGPGIKELNIGPNDTMDLNLDNAKDLKSINVDKQNKRYSTDGIALYVNDQGITKAICSIPEGIICDGKIKFVVANYSIYVEGTDNKKPCSLDLSIFDNYIKQYPDTTIEIGSGIKNINLSDQDVDISKAFDLKTINLGKNNKKYKVINKHLYTVNTKGKRSNWLGLIDKTPIFDFGLDMIDNLPKLEQGKKFEEIGKEKEFKRFLELTDFEKMKSDLINSRLKELNEPKLSKAEITKIENQIKGKKETYEKIRQVVEELKEKVERRTPKENPPKEDDIKEGGIYSKHYQMDKNWRIAKAIYRWVAENISYDNESTAEAQEKNGQERKSQDPFFVFNNKKGLCEGYSRLINQMMRMAGIPSVEITTIKDKDDAKIVHAYNAIYLPDSSNKKSGWVLLDSTWGSPNKDAREKNVIERGKEHNNFKLDGTPKADLSEEEKKNLKNKFPSFYSENINLKDDNEKIIKLPSHQIQYFSTEIESMAGEDIDDTYSVSSKDFIFHIINSVSCPLLRVDAKKSNGQSNQSSTELKISDIPEKLLESKIYIAPGIGIKTLDLGQNDSVEIEILDGSDLESIKVDKNNKRYFADEIALWEKNDKNEPDNICQFIKKDGFYKNGEYLVKYSLNFDGNYIQLEGIDIDFEKLPVSLKLIGKKYGSTFYIKNCTGSLHLGKDDDFFFYFDDSSKPTSIEIHADNPKYEVRNNALCDKKLKNQYLKLKAN